METINNFNTNQIENLNNIVKNIFSNNKLYYEWSVINDNTLYVYVENGDWKHDHISLKNILTNNSFILIDRNVYETDEDCYSAEYTFMYMK